MTTETPDNSALHHDEALITQPVTLLVQVGDNDPQPVGHDEMAVRGIPAPDGAGIIFYADQAEKAVVQAVLRILTNELSEHDEEARA